MASATHSTHPVQTLREQVLSLGVSIRACMDHPGRAAVHQLRITTRRIEAQFILLSLLTNLPPHRQQLRKARDLLSQLRHASGRLRDIDVQRDLTRVAAAADEAEPQPHRGLHNQARQLRRTLKRRRDRKAEALLRLLRRLRARVLIAFEDLLTALAPADSVSLTQSQLTTLICNWYASSAASQSPDAVPSDPAQLHDIRKHAKLARYLAESAPDSARTARRLATRFEAIQQAGGLWHDLHILARIAACELGPGAQLSQRFDDKAHAALVAFQRQLRYKI